MNQQDQATAHNAIKGFGLLEVLIASGILAIMAAAFVSIGNLSLSRAQLTQERLIAAYFIQEALELTRNARDSTYIDNLKNSNNQPNQWFHWFDGIDTDRLGEGPFYLEETSFNNSVPFWRLKTASEGSAALRYTLGSQIFERKIFVEEVPFNYPVFANLFDTAGNPVDESEKNNLIRMVRVAVNWHGGGRSLESVQFLSDWRFGR